MSEARFRIKRFDPVSEAPARYDTFVVPYEVSLTVLEGLFAIQERQDGSLSFRYCCRAAVCGSCAMYINGRYRLACQTNVSQLRGGDITVEPMPHLPLIKDLVCDIEVLDQRQVRHGLHRDVAAAQLADVGLAGEPVAAVDVHGARAADRGPAAVAKAQGAVLALLDGEQPFEHRQADLIGHDEGVVARRRFAHGIESLDAKPRLAHQYLRSCGSNIPRATGFVVSSGGPSGL